MKQRLEVNPYRAKPQQTHTDSVSVTYAFYFHRGCGLKTIEAELKLNIKDLTGILRKGNAVMPLAAAKTREGRLAFGELIQLVGAQDCNLADVEELVDLLGLNFEPPRPESPYDPLRRAYHELKRSVRVAGPAELVGIIEPYGDLGCVRITPDSLNTKLIPREASGAGSIPKVIVFTGRVETTIDERILGTQIYTGGFSLSVPRHGEYNVLVHEGTRTGIAADVDTN